MMEMSFGSNWREVQETETLKKWDPQAQVLSQDLTHHNPICLWSECCLWVTD